MQALAAAPLAMSGFSSILGGVNAQGQAKYNAGVDKIHAMQEDTAADQTDAALRRELETTKQNMDIMRVAANTSLDSPTYQAILQAETDKSDRQRTIQVQNYKNQAAADRADAQMQRAAGRGALLGGVIGGLGSFAGAAFKAGSYTPGASF